MRMYKAKLRREIGLSVEPGYPALSGPHYLPYLEQLHRKGGLSAYFEIGTESGASLAFASCPSVAVDPDFRLQDDVSRNKPQLHQYRMTSDDFFAGGHLDRLGLTFDLAFLDGMHLYEFLLRDFMGIERHMAPGGTVLMHDCVPWNGLVAARDWDRSVTPSWTGDVWKLIPILRRWRPDLTVRVLDLAPSGLVEVTGLDPSSRVLHDAHDAIRAEWDAITLPDYGPDRFAADLDLQPVDLGPAALLAAPLPLRRILSAWEAPATPAARPRSIAIKTSVPGPAKKEGWGDYHFARGLADAFLRSGHRVRVDSVREWHSEPGSADVDLVLHGTEPFAPRGGVPMLAWVLYPGREDGDAPVDASFGGALDGAAHVFLASGPAAQAFAVARPGTPCSTLLQGFDAARMSPPETAGNGMVFVGKNHFAAKGGRPIVELALAAGIDFRLWGTGWRGHPAAALLQGRQLDNAGLGDAYRAARIVMCDHMDGMRRGGYVSNRIFDALACGAAVISDAIEGLPEEFAPFVTRVTTPQEFRDAVDAIETEPDRDTAARLAFAARMAETHSFDARVRTILSHIEQLA